MFNILSTIESRAHGQNLRTDGSQAKLFLGTSSDSSESHDNSQPVHKESLQTQVIHIIYTVPASWIIHKEIYCGHTPKSM